MFLWAFVGFYTGPNRTSTLIGIDEYIKSWTVWITHALEVGWKLFAVSFSDIDRLLLIRVSDRYVEQQVRAVDVRLLSRKNAQLVHSRLTRVEQRLFF